MIKHWKEWRFLAGISFTVSLLAFAYFIFIDLPIMTGRVILDAPDPNRPGHMIGIGVSLSEVLIVWSLIVVGIVIRRTILKKLREEYDKQQ